MELTDLTLAAASQLLRSRQISSLELTDGFLARVAALNPTLNAFITVTEEVARADARRADEEIARGAYRGPLHGIPVALKDLFDTAGIRTTAGARILRDRVPGEDAHVTQRLRAAGAVLLGKLNMHEFAFGATSENPHFGNVRNPWDVQRISGGSSGGSAVAIAARLCLGAVGSDTGGSIRIPSALVGVTGLKPTYGRVSLRGVIPLSWSMDHAGPLAQSAEDAALLLQALAGYDPLDPASVDVPVPDYGAALDQPLTGVRLAVPSGYFGIGVDKEVQAAVEGAVRVLAEAGAVVIEREMPFAEELFLTNRAILFAEAAAYHRDYLETRREDYGADVLERLQAGTRISAVDYVLARRHQAEQRRALELYFADVDVVATPTTRMAAPGFGSDAVAMARHLTAFTGPFNTTGTPAISIPCGFTSERVPIGLQLAARAWNEPLLLRVAHQYQRQTDWHRRLPPLGEEAIS